MAPSVYSRQVWTDADGSIRSFSFVPPFSVFFLFGGLGHTSFVSSGSLQVKCRPYPFH